MIFNSSNSGDINKYYLHTFVKFKEHGDMLFRIDGVDKFKVSGTTETGDPFVLYLDDTFNYEIDYVLPHKSFFQLGANACQLQRIPAQQYQRGLNNKNTRMAFAKADGAGFVPIDITFESLKAFVTKQKFFSLKEAVANKDKFDSYTLSPRIAYIPRKKIILVDFTAVAHVNEVDKLIKMTRPIFTDEIISLLKSHNEAHSFKFV